MQSEHCASCANPQYQLRYWLLLHLMQSEQTMSVFPYIRTHWVLMYWSLGQKSVHSLIWMSDVPLHGEATYSNSPGFRVEHGTHGYCPVEAQSIEGLGYWPEGHSVGHGAQTGGV